MFAAISAVGATFVTTNFPDAGEAQVAVGEAPVRLQGADSCPKSSGGSWMLRMLLVLIDAGEVIVNLRVSVESTLKDVCSSVEPIVAGVKAPKFTWDCSMSWASTATALAIFSQVGKATVLIMTKT